MDREAHDVARALFGASMRFPRSAEENSRRRFDSQLRDSCPALSCNVGTRTLPDAYALMREDRSVLDGHDRLAANCGAAFRPLRPPVFHPTGGPFQGAAGVPFHVAARRAERSPLENTEEIEHLARAPGGFRRA
jgi:hypothetical protein